MSNDRLSSIKFNFDRFFRPPLQQISVKNPIIQARVRSPQEYLILKYNNMQNNKKAIIQVAISKLTYYTNWSRKSFPSTDYIFTSISVVIATMDDSRCTAIS